MQTHLGLAAALMMLQLSEVDYKRVCAWFPGQSPSARAVELELCPTTLAC